jgi:hypothetical protein
MRRKGQKLYGPVRAFSEADSDLYALILKAGSRLTMKIGAIEGTRLQAGLLRLLRESPAQFFRKTGKSLFAPKENAPAH